MTEYVETPADRKAASVTSRVERGRTVDGGRRRRRKSYVQSVFHNPARRQGVPRALPVASAPWTAWHGSQLFTQARKIRRLESAGLLKFSR
jgi:hypothetical protein